MIATMKIRYIYLFLSLAFTLPVLADMNYKLTTDAVMPVAKFQNTGALNATGSPHASIVMIDEEGYAYFGGTPAAHTPVVPRRIIPPTPEGPPTPLGDAVLPLLLMAATFGVWRTWRRKREIMA